MTEAEKLFTETFFRALKAQGFIFALRQVADIGARLGGASLRAETRETVQHILGRYALFKDTEGFIAAGLHEKMADEMTQATLKQAQVAVEAAALIFAHSVLDAAALGYCKVAALIAPEEWAELVERRAVELREVRLSSYPELLRDRLGKFFEDLDQKPLISKIDLLFQRCKPPGGWKPLEGYDYDRERLIRIDGVRHEVVHGKGPEAALDLRPDDHEFVQRTHMLLLLLVHQRYGIQLVPEYMFPGAGRST